MYNTGNPIGSTAPKDFSDNSEITDRYVNDVVNETTLDRFGRQRLTIHGQQEKARRSFEQFESDADNVIANLGFFPPVDYKTGLTVDSRNFTVTYNGVVYAVQPSAVPFTTGAWDADQWYPIQNLLNQKNLLVFDTYAEASAAAATLPDGQTAEASDADGQLSRFEVQSGALVFKDFAPDTATVDSIAVLRSISSPVRKRVVEVLGHNARGDGGGRAFLWVPASSKPDNGITVIQPASMPTNGRWECGPRDGALPFSWAGIFPNSGVEETTRINALLALADALKCKVRAPSGRYLHNGYYNSSANYHFDLEGDDADPPVFEATQAAVDAGTVRLFRCEPNDAATILSGVGLAQSAYPNDRGVYLTSVAGVSPGMVIQLSSDELWYYDPRGIYTKGELHVVRSVDAGTGYVGFEDMVRDSYLTTDGYTKYVRAWTPSTFRLKNIEMAMPLATVPASSTTIGVQYMNAYEPEVTNVSARGMVNWGIKSIKCIRPRYTKIRGQNIGAGLSNGYCVQDNGSLGLVIFDIDTVGCRRAFDAHGLQGNNGCVSRDWLVMNFRIAAGGAYFPDTAEESYGLGMHGPTENGKYAHGFIRDVMFGINSRSRNIEVDNVNFGGTMLACVSASYGAGLNIHDCSTDGNDFSQKTGRAGTQGITDFVRFGISTGSEEPNFLYTLPIVIKNNTLPGLRASLIRFMSPTNARNFSAEGNIIDARPINDGTYINDGVFRLIANGSGGGTYTVSGRTPNNTVSVTGGSYALRPSNNMLIGISISGVIEPMQVDYKEWLATMPKDTVLKIAGFCRPGERPIVSINADAAGMSLVRITPANAALTAVGSGNSATIVGTATAESLTGTVGTDGNITVGITASGDLWLENRSAGGAKQIRVSRLS